MTHVTPSTTPVAVVTGASRGLGLALATALADRGWHLVVDARDPDRLAIAAAALRERTEVTAIPGDVTDPAHRQGLAAAVREAGRLDLLVNNASILGPSPSAPLVEHPLVELRQVFEVNTFAPLALVQLLLRDLQHSGGRLVNISSDAAVEAYEGWGGYGSAKAALEHLTAVLAVELPDLRCYAVDPGDMATDLHQQAFPGEDISDRPAAATVVPALLRLVDGDLANGRYRAADLRPQEATTAAGTSP